MYDQHGQNMTAKKPRELNIELLRCFLMLCIVIYHGCNNGPFAVDGQNHDVKFVAWLLFWATNAFVFISGWYGIRFSFKRLGKFLGQGLYAALVLLLLSPLTFGHFSWCYSLGWFGNCYLALMLVSPILNAALERLSQGGGLNKAWLAYTFAMLISALPIRTLGINLSVPDWCGHDFNTMMYLYVTAFVCRRNVLFCNLNLKQSLMIFLAANLVHVLCLGLTVMSPLMRRILANSLDYNSPAMLLAGAMMFSIFRHVKIGSDAWLGRVAAFLAPSVFMVYLLHIGCGSIGNRLMNKFLLCFDALIQTIPCHRIATVVLGGICVFAIAVLIDMPRCLFVRRHNNIE